MDVQNGRGTCQEVQKNPQNTHYKSEDFAFACSSMHFQIYVGAIQLFQGTFEKAYSYSNY